MKRFRHFRSLTALVALSALLFSQIAVACYACPFEATSTTTRSTGAPADTSSGNMPGCNGMDLEQPALCQAHAQAGSQSVDKPYQPDIPAFASAGIRFVLDDPDAAIHLPPRSAQYPLARNSAPPIAVRNCCFRI